MRRRFFLVVAGLLVCWGPLLESHAQQLFDVQVGARLGREVDFIREPLIGGELRIGVDELIPYVNTINPVFDYYIISDSVDMWQAEINGLSMPRVDALVKPYAGLGIGVLRLENTQGREQTKIGVPLILGFMVDLPVAQPFIQARAFFGDFETFVISGGVLFRLYRKRR